MRKYHPMVYVAMRRGGMSNRQTADLLGVNEASVRRGLKAMDVGPDMSRSVRDVLSELAELLESPHPLLNTEHGVT